MLCIVYSSAISDFKTNTLVDPVLNRLFSEASASILAEAGSVDEGLRIGHLTSGTCIRMLDRATGEDCYDVEKWTVKKVREMERCANWDFRYLTEATWAYLSAKAFLSICADRSLTINFFLVKPSEKEVY